MKKLKLDAEALEVESFDAAGVEGLRATVHARQDSYLQPCPISEDITVCGTCPGVDLTCDRICPISGDPSCGKYCTPTCWPEEP